MILTPIPVNTTSAASTETFIAGETISGHKVVSLLSGKIYKAQLSNLPESIVGLIKAAVTINNSVEVFWSGSTINGFSGLTPNATYFLDTNGSLTSTPPTSGLLMKVGIAIDASTMALNFSDGVIRP